MIRKNEYTIANVLNSRRPVLTTRFYVSPDRLADTKNKLTKLFKMYPDMRIIDIPLHKGLDEFIEASTYEYYSPSKISMDVASTASTLNREWARDKVISTYRNKIENLLTKNACLEGDNEAYLTHIEINRAKVIEGKQTVEILEQEKSMRSERAVGLDKQIKEIELDGVWQVFDLTQYKISLVTQFPMVLTCTDTGNMLQIGKWILTIEYFNGPNNIRLVPLQSSIVSDNYYHPNVSGNHPCLGENFEKIDELFRILDITRFFTGFLTSYTHHNPYIRFNRMFETAKVWHPSHVNYSIDMPYPTFIDVAKILASPTNYDPLLVRLVYLLEIDKEMKVPEGYRPTQYYKDLYPDDFEMVDEVMPEDEEVEDETDWHTVETSNELTDDELALRRNA